MKNLLKSIPFVVISVVVSISSKEINAMELVLGPQVHDINYREMTNSGRRLVNEKGQIYGEFFAINNNFTEKVHVGLAYSRTDGDLTYDGMTNSGRELQSIVHYDTKKYSLTLSYDLWAEQVLIKPLIRVDKVQWQRSIDATNISLSAGYEYDWMEYGVGFIVERQFESHAVVFQMERLIAHSAEVVVDFRSAGLNRSTLNLDDGDGVQLSLKWKFNATSYIQIVPEIAYSRWAFDASDVKQESAGFIHYEIQEPETVNEKLSGQVALVYVF